MFDTRVLSLGIFSNDDGIDIVVRSFETDDRSTRSNVGEKGEGSSEGEIEGDVSLSD